ncbi:MAG: DoxX family protein [Candidatus Dormibacteraceae bacterium]
MKIKTILYWLTTTLIALETFAGGVVDLTHGRTGVFNGPRVADVVSSLGYPVYVLAILGIWKIPGAITLVVPRFLRLKEWAYAGIVFELSAAAVSHALCGHRSEVVAPLILLGLALASWALRPASRILGATLTVKAD